MFVSLSSFEIIWLLHGVAKTASVCFRGCLLEKQDGTVFILPSWKKLRQVNFWQDNIKNLFCQNRGYKCKQRA